MVNNTQAKWVDTNKFFSEEKNKKARSTGMPYVINYIKDADRDRS
jgi:hypothetical protein